MPKQTLALKDKLRVINLLDAHLKPSVEAPGFYVYEEGWSDGAVAIEIGGVAHKDHINSIRRQLDPVRQLRAHRVAPSQTGDARLDEVIDKHNRLAAMVAPLDETLLIKA